MNIVLDLRVETKVIPFPKLWSLKIPDQNVNRFHMLCPLLKQPLLGVHISKRMLTAVPVLARALLHLGALAL
jgi:hypothetical protein